jgi:hypothetical protein
MTIENNIKLLLFNFLTTTTTCPTPLITRDENNSELPAAPNPMITDVAYSSPDKS